MKLSKKFSVLCCATLLAAPAAMLADSATDHDIARDATKNMPKNIAGMVSVSVDGGVATVTGTVATSDQRRIAIDAVKQVPEVKSVNDEIQVNKDMSRDATATAADTEPADHHSDKWIAFKVKSTLLTHSNVSATHTDVNVVDGVVTLSGTAKNSAQKELTAQYARDVQGVRDVKNDIQVVGDNDGSTFTGDQYQGRTTGDKIDDSGITTKVKFQLAKHRSTSAMKTHVETRDGVVYLSGNADTSAQKDLVTKLAQDVPGVTSVQNDMNVINP